MRRTLRLVRPFTLLPPLLGIVSGAVCAFGSAHNPDPSRHVTWAVVLTVAIGSLCASVMNAASNIVNQIADLEIDRTNKPERPLVTREISIRRAWLFAAAGYVFASTITPQGPGDEATWSPTSATLIYGDDDTILVDTLATHDQVAALADWIATKGRRLSRIYITHGHSVGRLLERVFGHA